MNRFPDRLRGKGPLQCGRTAHPQSVMGPLVHEVLLVLGHTFGTLHTSGRALPHPGTEVGSRIAASLNPLSCFFRGDQPVVSGGPNAALLSCIVGVEQADGPPGSRLAQVGSISGRECPPSGKIHRRLHYFLHLQPPELLLMFRPLAVAYEDLPRSIPTGSPTLLSLWRL